MRAAALPLCGALAAALLIAPAAQASDACDDARTTQDLNDCARQQLHAAEAELNLTYRQLRARLAANPDCADCVEAGEHLLRAQRLWVDFRERDCKAVYTLYRGGTIRSLMHLGCMTEHANTRTRQLRSGYTPAGDAPAP